MTAVLRLRADAGMRLPAADAKWCALFPRGKWTHHTGGEIDFTPELAAQFIASWKAEGSPPLPITLHHVPDDLDVVAKREAGEAEGWIEDLRVGTGDVALEGAVKWTEPAKALIAADRYRYLSPEWSMQHVDRRTGEVGGPWLFGAALLNDPFFHTMPRVAASAAPSPTHSPNAAKAEEQKTMKSIALALRLPENATEEQLVEAAKKLVATNDAHAEKLTAANASTAKLTTLQEGFDTLKASHEATKAELAKVKSEKHDADVKALFSKAKREGKVVTEKLAASLTKLAASNGIAAAEEFLAELPVTVSLREVGHGESGDGEDTPETASKKLTAATEKLAKDKGLTMSEARIQALTMHPELARIAARNSTTNRNTKEA